MVMAKSIHELREIEVPEDVKVVISGNTVTVEGPKGKLTRTFNIPKNISLRVEDNKVIVETFFANRRLKALVGTIASHIRNMIKGVKEGYRYKLKIIYSHFPISVKVEGDKVIIENFLGEKAPRIAKIVGEDVKVKVEGEDIIVEGLNIEHVGQTAANIELATKIKEYDPRVFMDGIYIYERE